MRKNSVYLILQVFKVLYRAGHHLYATLGKKKSTALRKRKIFLPKIALS